MTSQPLFRNDAMLSMTCDGDVQQDVDRRAVRWIERIRNVVQMCRAWRESFRGQPYTRNGSRRVQSMLAVLQAKVDSLSLLLDRYARHPERLEPEHAQVFEERIEALVRCALQLDRVANRSERVSFDPLQSMTATQRQQELARLLAS